MPGISRARRSPRCSRDRSGTRTGSWNVIFPSSANALQTLWTTTWLLPSGATACADTGINRPSSSATGVFPLTSVAPGTAQSFLEVRDRLRRLAPGKVAIGNG